MSKTIDVVKRGGRRATEQFDRQKLHSSVVAACLSVRAHEGHAESTATNVCDIVILWLDNKPEVTSSDLRRQASKALETHHPEAAYFYNHHRVIM